MNLPAVSAAAQRLHADSLVCDLTFPFTDYGQTELKYRMLERMAASGFDYVSLTVGGDWTSLETTMHAIARERAYFLARREQYLLVETAADIEQAKAKGKLAIGLHFQGTNPVGYDVAMVEPFYKLGIRHMLMAYNLKTPVGDGCQEVTDDGLSRFGRSLVDAMNRVGMWVDVAHTGYRTSMDVFAHSDRPVIVSHANARALCDHTRNIRDDQIKACAKSGGVIGIIAFGPVLGPDEVPIVELMARHIDHMCQLVGARHVGLALDLIYDQSVQNTRIWNPYAHPRPVKDIAPEELVLLTEALIRRGYAEPDIRGILGGNWLRMAHEIWK